MSQGKVLKVSGPLVVASGMEEANMYDVVHVGEQGLIGEIIEMRGDKASIQVYEETAGIGPGVPVVTTGAPLSVELGPGLIETMYDGIQRPLEEMRQVAGSNITRGIKVPSLSRTKKWAFVPTVKVGDEVEAGDIIGTVQETIVVEQRIMVPYGVAGVVESIEEGEFTVEETVCKVRLADGSIKELRCTADIETGTNKPDRKIKGTIHWLSAKYAENVTVMMYDKLFNIENTGDIPEDKTYDDYLNINSVTKCENCKVEPALKDAEEAERFQFVRNGYFGKDTKNENTFNLIVGLKDSFKKG